VIFRFEIRKTIQAAAELLRLERARQMNYMRLLKLLYIADRESLKETGRPITGDRAVAMERGPVLSTVLDLIKGQHIESPTWSKYLRKEGYHLELQEDPGKGGLSRYEIGKLQEISRRYEDCDEWDMVAIAHEFEEWKRNDPGKSSRPIPLDDILSAIGRAGDRESIIEDARDEAIFDRFFAGPTG